MSGVIRAAFRGSLGRFTLDAAFTVPARGVTALFGVGSLIVGGSVEEVEPFSHLLPKLSQD